MLVLSVYNNIIDFFCIYCILFTLMFCLFQVHVRIIAKIRSYIQLDDIFFYFQLIINLLYSKLINIYSYI